MVLYFVHLAALGVYALIVFGHEISVYLESRRRHAGMHKIPWPAALLQFAPPLALFISSSPTFHINLGSAGLLSVWFKIQGIYSIFDSGNRPIDVPYFLLEDVQNSVETRGSPELVVYAAWAWAGGGGDSLPSWSSNFGKCR